MKTLCVSLCTLILAIHTASAVIITTADLTGNIYQFSDQFSGFTGTNNPENWTSTNLGGDSPWQGTNNGSSSSGGKYSYGTNTGETYNGSFGFLPTATNAIYADISFTNDTSLVITSFNVSYLGVHWRSAQNGRNNGWAVSYAINEGAFTALNELTFIAPNTLATGSGPHDSELLEQSISNLFIEHGSTITFRFFGDNGTGSGSRQGVAFDDFSFNASFTPEPSAILLALLGILPILTRRQRP